MNYELLILNWVAVLVILVVDFGEDIAKERTDTALRFETCHILGFLIGIFQHQVYSCRNLRETALCLHLCYSWLCIRWIADFARADSARLAVSTEVHVGVFADLTTHGLDD